MKWEMVHYDVQLIGGIVIHQGKIANANWRGKNTFCYTSCIFEHLQDWEFTLLQLTIILQKEMQNGWDLFFNSMDFL